MSSRLYKKTLGNRNVYILQTKRSKKQKRYEGSWIAFNTYTNAQKFTRIGDLKRNTTVGTKSFNPYRMFSTEAINKTVIGLNEPESIPRGCVCEEVSGLPLSYVCCRCGCNSCTDFYGPILTTIIEAIPN